MAEPATAPAVKTLSCPNCGGTATLRAAGYSVTVACEYCASILDVSGPEVQLVIRYQEEAGKLPIPLGSRGTLDGVEWEVVGWMGREDAGYPWQEVLLFNPYHGYRWLVGQRGGWSLGEQLTVSPKRGFRSVEVEGEHYQAFFAGGKARVDYVVGEFYWRVRRGDTVKTDDWVRPGAMLSREEDANEVSWSRSRWLAPGTVDKAFGVHVSHRPWPPLPHQPSLAGAFLKRGALIALAVILIMCVAGLVSRGKETLYRGSAEIAADGRDQETTVGPIALKGARQRVRVETDVPGLSNGWVDLGFTLVNRADQATFVAEQAAEQYSGTDSDGSWSEGSGKAGADFASIPAGTYDLLIDYKGNNWVDPSRPTSQTSYTPWSFGEQTPVEAPDWRKNREFAAPSINIEVTRIGGSGGGVLFLMLLLVAAPLLIGVVIHFQFESARRGESDFAVSSDDDGED